MKKIDNGLPPEWSNSGTADQRGPSVVWLLPTWSPCKTSPQRAIRGLCVPSYCSSISSTLSTNNNDISITYSVTTYNSCKWTQLKKKIETKQIDQPVSCRQDQEERRHRTENSKIGFILKNRWRGYVWVCDYVVDGTRYGLSLCSFGSDSATAGWKNSGGKKLHSIT